jgi:mRNA interferase RelE/StbE
MAYKIEFLPDAAKDFDRLGGSLRKQSAKKIDALAENPLLGDPLGNKLGIDLTGFYKLYFAKKKYRIVYRIVHERIEVIEIAGIGKRDKAEIYKIMAKRIKKLKTERKKALAP